MSIETSPKDLPEPNKPWKEMSTLICKSQKFDNFVTKIDDDLLRVEAEFRSFITLGSTKKDARNVVGKRQS